MTWLAPSLTKDSYRCSQICLTQSLAAEELMNFIETEKTGINSEEAMRKAFQICWNLPPKSIKLRFFLRTVQKYEKGLSLWGVS